MSAATVLAIAIPVIVLIAAIGVIAAARRRDASDATGALSRETRRRDRGEPSTLPEPPPELTGREVEQAAAEARRGGGTAVMLAEKAPIAPYVPPDPEAVAVTRRQFFNRGIVTFMILALSGFGAAVLAFLWPKRGGGFGSKITLGKLEDVKASIQQADGFFYVPEGRAWITEYPVDAFPKAEKSGVYPEPVLERDEERHQRAVPEVPPPRLPRPAVHHLAVVRVPVPRLAVQPGRREEGRPCTARHESLRRRSRQRHRHDRHEHRVRWRAHRHQHHRSGSGRSALHHRG